MEIVITIIIDESLYRIFLQPYHIRAKYEYIYCYNIIPVKIYENKKKIDIISKVKVNVDESKLIFLIVLNSFSSSFL